jgi:BlaI family penicillinase repressor
VTEPMPTDRELAVLKILWRRPSATVRQICEALEEEGVQLAYTTVLTFMQIMEKKGLVGHECVGKAYAYFPKLRRDRTFQKLAGRFLDKVFDGAMDEYVLHALQSRPLSVEALERLEKIFAAAKKRSKRKRKKGGR